MPVGGKRAQRARSADNGKCGGNMKAGLPPRVGVSLVTKNMFRDCTCRITKGTGKCK
tara:strand:- start:493 stop:663 length:171 start_codon:yes stop_codon:yes gene_type:complete